MSVSINSCGVEPRNWTEMFNELEKDYKEAYFRVDKAIDLDEKGKTSEALFLYEQSLSLIDKALSSTINEPSNPNFLWEKAVVMLQKLRKTRKEIILRVENLKPKPEEKEVNLPPSYEEVISGLKPQSLGTSNSNGNTFELPGPSKADDPYIPPSAIQDKKLLANLHLEEQGNFDTPITYSDLTLQLKEMKLAKNEEILFRCDNAQIFFIAPDGRVSSTSESQTLIFARVHDETCNILDEALLNIVANLSKEMSEKKRKRRRHPSLHRKHRQHKEKKILKKVTDETLDQNKRTFLQVGSWVYPLISDVSPCIRTEFGAFILPDINSGIEGAAVGIILPKEVGDQVHELFTNLLNEASTTGRFRRSIVVDNSSNSISSRFAQKAVYIAHGLIKGAGSTARFLDHSTPKIMDRINPNPEPKSINPTIQKTVEVAKTVSGKAVDVTDYLATKICMATSALGRYLSPYIQQQGTRLLASTTNMSQEEASQKFNSMLNATSDAVEGISTIYGGLNTAASILAQSLANNTVQIIEYKYGQPAGALTNDALTTFGNVYYTHHNFRVLKPKGIAKAAVRGAGQALLEDYRTSAHLKPHEEFRGSGPGDGSGFSST